MMFDVKLKSPGEVSYSLLENRGYRSLNYRNALWYWMGGGKDKEYSHKIFHQSCGNTLCLSSHAIISIPISSIE